MDDAISYEEDYGSPSDAEQHQALGGLSHAEQMVLLIVPKVVAFCSTFGSIMIISQIVRNQPNRSQMQQQIVLGLSVVDVFVSVTWVFNNFFMPEWGILYYPLGNEATCSAQGFFTQGNITAVLYSTTLSIYYVAVIKYNYSECKLKKWKWRVHVIPLGFGLGTAITGLVLKLYNPAAWDCWIAPPPPPPDCAIHNICDRGSNWNTYQWAFFFGPLWACIVLVVINMAVVVKCVHAQERKMAKWTIRGSQSRDRRKRRNEKLRILYIQSLLYIGSFLATWIFPTITRIAQLGMDTSTPSWLYVIGGCTVPIAGVFNSVAYFSPRYRKEKAHSGDHGVVVAWRIVKLALGCCTCQCECPNACKGEDTVLDTGTDPHADENAAENGRHVATGSGHRVSIASVGSAATVAIKIQNDRNDIASWDPSNLESESLMVVGVMEKVDSCEENR